MRQTHLLSSVLFLSCGSFFLAGSGLCADRGEPLTLWYRQPAAKWEEALPVGNGRLGAMVFGRVQRERIQLNEQTIWAGPPVPEPKPGGAAVLAKARQLFFGGKFSEGERLIETELLPRPIEPRSYQPLGDLELTFKHTGQASGYRRSLELDTAVAATSYQADGVTFTREVFASGADDVIVVRVSASERGSINCEVRLSRADGKVSASGNNTLVLQGQAAHGDKHKGVKFESHLRVFLDEGIVKVDGDVLRVEKASALTLILAAATDYNREAPAAPLRGDLGRVCEKALKRSARDYASLKKASVAAHQKLFGRVSLVLGPTPARPTDERLAAVRGGASDPALEAMYFQFGRYLLISSSRPGGLPANLQGLWNEHMQAPWNADYHININIQMNYWPAEVGNLSECHEPFFHFADALRPAGRRAASEAFGCRGFCACLTSDPWLWTTPYGSARWGMWVMGGAWCTQHFMEHYRFTGDREFLRKRAYPILKEASEFFLDWLVPDPKTGRLVSGPSTSPENGYVAPDGKTVTLSMGCSMDQEIIWDTFSNTIEAAAELGIRDEFTASVQRALEKLALPRIGSDGRLMEWAEEFKEPEPGHRHVSHLFAIHPGRQYTMDNAPEMVAAARKSIEYRLAHGGGHTGWSRAWIINFWARFRDGEKAHENVVALLQKSTFPDLFDNHPPFQIDGNFGGAAGIAEMLLQSHERTKRPGLGGGREGSEAQVLQLLPALPKAWGTGSVAGLRARGGFEVSMRWADGALTEASITSLLGRACEVRCGGKAVQLATRRGKAYRFGPDLAEAR